MFEFKPWQLMLIFIVFYYLLSYVGNEFIANSTFFKTIWENQLGDDDIERMILMRNRNYWVLSVSLPIILFIKYNILSCLIYLINFFYERSISYTNCLKIILIAEFISIMSFLTKSIYLIICPPNSLFDVNTNPLSISKILCNKNTPAYLSYPFDVINVFELMYWLVLTWGISHFLNTSYRKSFKYVASTYGIGLLIWTLVMLFIKLQFS